ncbi:MAG TPA: macro domain-containing protein, partial [Herpetosiphonaceae bacterium]
APGQAVLTGPGRLPLRGIIHAACIQPWSRSDPELIALAARNAAALAAAQGFASIAMPLLGAGSGGMDEDEALSILRRALADAPYDGAILLVRYQPPAR